MHLRVITYNIHKGFDTLGVSYTLKSIKALLKNLNVDICLLQEIGGFHKIESNKLKGLTEKYFENEFEFLADEIWPHYSYGQNAIFTRRHHGNAILSRFPLVQKQNLNLTLHNLEKRGCLHCQVDTTTVALPGKNLHLLNSHINLRQSDRHSQVETVIEYIHKHIEPQSALLWGGDFNDWNLKIHHQIQEQLPLKEAYTQLHQSLPKTFPTFFPLLSLDRIYFRHLHPVQARVLDDLAWRKSSDHLPLLVDFEL